MYISYWRNPQAVEPAAITRPPHPNALNCRVTPHSNERTHNSVPENDGWHNLMNIRIMDEELGKWMNRGDRVSSPPVGVQWRELETRAPNQRSEPALLIWFFPKKLLKLCALGFSAACGAFNCTSSLLCSEATQMRHVI